MKAQIIFSFIVFVAYTLATIIVFGILPSLSASYYKWEEKHKCGWLFSATMFTMAVTLLPAWLTLSEGHFSISLIHLPCLIDFRWCSTEV